MRPLHDRAGRLVHGTAAAGPRELLDVAIAVVVDLGDPLRLGRVRVELPVASEHDATAWAPVVMPGAGAGRGWFFVPDVGDEVLVAFEHGDVGRPIVVGALWPGGGREARIVVASRTGHRVTLDDERGTVVLEDGGGRGRVTLDAGAGTVVIEALAGDVCLDAPEGAVTLVGERVVIEAGRDVMIRAGATAAVAAGDALGITGRAVAIAGAPVDVGCDTARRARSAERPGVVELADPYR